MGVVYKVTPKVKEYILKNVNFYIHMSSKGLSPNMAHVL